MPFPSDDKSTLAGFDMILSITEPAINNQLKLLYNTPIKTGPLPPPGTKQPRPEYLIRRKIELHPPKMMSDLRTFKKDERGNIVYSQGGVVGWIAPPMVKLNTRADLRTSANVSLKFISNPDPIDGEPKDSVYKQWVSDEDTPGSWVSTNINNWTFSWDADLSSRDIQVVQEIATVPEGVRISLEGYVNSKLFTVSSIFCLMESVKITNTLRAKDEGGNEVNGPFLSDFLKALIAWFEYELAANGVKPTNPQNVNNIPQNPFVLGYGISQKTPPEPGKPMFQPRRYIFSTNNGSENDMGALNFCMVTTDDRTIDPKQDPRAGFFPLSLSKKVNLNYNDPNNLEADGVMAISNGIFFTEYLQRYFAKATNNLDFSDDVLSANPGRELKITSAPNPTRNGPNFTTSKAWELKVPGHDSSRNGLLIEERAIYNGNSSFEITWKSDPVPSSPHSNDVQRRAYITISSRASVSYYSETRTRGSLIDHWDDMARSNVLVSLRVVYIIYTTPDGKWFLEQDKTNSFLPKITTDKDGKKIVDFTNNAPEPTSTVGCWKWGGASGFFGTFGGSDLGSSLEELSNWGSIDIGKLNDTLDSVMGELQMKIILPAGNVFMFKGLNVTEEGDVICPVTYASISHGEQFLPN